jgi:hypothetical protein
MVPSAPPRGCAFPTTSRRFSYQGPRWRTSRRVWRRTFGICGSCRLDISWQHDLHPAWCVRHGQAPGAISRSPLALILWLTALAGVPLLILAMDRPLSRMDGAILIASFSAAIFSLHRAIGAASTSEPDRDSGGERKQPPRAWLLGGLAAFTVGGELLGHGLQAVVSRFSISALLLDDTAIADLIEAEEIGRIAVPAQRGRPDMAAANIGSRAILILTLNAGTLSLVVPLHLDDATMRLHLPVAIAAPSVFCLILLISGVSGRAKDRSLLAFYVACISAAVVDTLGQAG